MPNDDAPTGDEPGAAAYGSPPALTPPTGEVEPEVDIHGTGSTDDAGGTSTSTIDNKADAVQATETTGSKRPTAGEIGILVAAAIAVVALMLSGGFPSTRSNDTLGNKRSNISQQDEPVYVEPDPMTFGEIDVTALAASWSTDGITLSETQLGTTRDLNSFYGTPRDHYHRWTPTTSGKSAPTVFAYTRTPEDSAVNKPLEDDPIVLVSVGITDKLVATFNPLELDPLVLKDPAGFASAVKEAVRGVSPGDQVIIDVEKYGGEVLVYLETSSAVKQAAIEATEAKFKTEQDRLLNQIASSPKPNEVLVQKLIKSAVAAEEAKGLGPTDLYVAHAYGSNLEPTAPNGTPLPEWMFGEHGDFLVSHDPGRESDYSIPIWFDLGRG